MYYGLLLIGAKRSISLYGRDVSNIIIQVSVGDYNSLYYYYFTDNHFMEHRMLI